MWKTDVFGANSYQTHIAVPAVFQKNDDILYQLRNLSKIVLKVAPEKKNKTSWCTNLPKAKSCYDQIFKNLSLLPKCNSLKQWLKTYFIDNVVRAHVDLNS